MGGHQSVVNTQQTKERMVHQREITEENEGPFAAALTLNRTQANGAPRISRRHARSVGQRAPHKPGRQGEVTWRAEGWPSEHREHSTIEGTHGSPK